MSSPKKNVRWFFCKKQTNNTIIIIIHSSSSERARLSSDKRYCKTSTTKTIILLGKELDHETRTTTHEQNKKTYMHHTFLSNYSTTYCTRTIFQVEVWLIFDSDSFIHWFFLFSHDRLNYLFNRKPETKQDRKERNKKLQTSVLTKKLIVSLLNKSNSRSKHRTIN